MPIFCPPTPLYKCLRNKWMVPLEIDEGITDSPDGSLRDAATATDFDPSDSSVPRYVKDFFSKIPDLKNTGLFISFHTLEMSCFW